MKLTHVDPKGKAQMVDVSDKVATKRVAKAYAKVNLSNIAFTAVKQNSLKKGDALAVAKLAGICAAKKTSELIPLCHNIFIANIDVVLSLNEKCLAVEINSEATSVSQTGVEMEALVAASVAALTVYDMCKALDKAIVISDVHLLSKTGGKSGDYKHKEVKK
jgi:molybdenum cofactor biosynthesis protein MoaC